MVGRAVALKSGFGDLGLGITGGLLALAPVRGWVKLVNTGLLLGWAFAAWRAVAFNGAEEPLERLADGVIVARF